MYIYKPLQHIIVTQPFGVNYASFYQQLGLAGHNGEDYRCNKNEAYACFPGWIKDCGEDSSGGRYIEIVSYDKFDDTYLKAIYYHLDTVGVEKNKSVKVGDLIAITDNTGKYTTGPHLHFGIKRCDVDGNTYDYNNGYGGGINFQKYVEPDYYKLPSDLLYYKKRNWLAEWTLRFKNAWVHRQLIKVRSNPLWLTADEVNFIIYGAWDFWTAINPSMYPICSFLTKKEYEDGKTPPKGFTLSVGYNE